MTPTQFAAKWLTQLEIEPVIVDVGASGAVPLFWKALAPHAFYIGFDPDAREMQHHPERGFKRAQIFSNAVVATPHQSEITVFLTRSPQCSSTLKPLQDSLDNYVFGSLFQVESQTKCAAIMLEAALEESGVAGVDWLKLDTQGTDYRIFAALGEAKRSRVLAIDVEPGLVDAYAGEDLFAPTHMALLKEGFWPVQMKICGVGRGHAESWEQIGWTSERAANALHPSPVWVEARYLRDIKWMRERATKREWVLLGLFAAIEKQWGFVLDVTRELEKWDSHVAASLRDWAKAELEKAEKQRRSRFLARGIVGRIKRMLP